MHLMLISAFNFNDFAPAVARHKALLSGWVRGRVGPASLCLVTTPSGSEPTFDPDVFVKGVGRPGRFWRLHALRGLSTLVSEMAARDELPDVALVIDRDSLFLPAAIAILKRHGIVVLHEVTEYPDVVLGNGVRGRLELEVFRRGALPRLDGVLVISPQIASWARGFTSSPIIRVAGIVDTSGPSPAGEPDSSRGVLIGYCGSLNEAKDGVSLLVRALAGIADRAVRLRVVAGPHSDEQRRDLDDVVRASGMENRVEVVGPVPSNEVQQLLSECHVLALPRPASRQAEGGFPTKLGEYLSTGRPVVVSAVGSIPGSLRHRSDALLVAPGDVGQLSAALEELVVDRRLRETIGRAGRTRAEQDWSPVRAAESIARFIENEVSARG
ncbi:glycosyltransferase family 4 protein [Ornithinimicrobium cerasi]|uniref:glycosyltransferase family 4 protein n=1 Tax=Ornithinimicrobium cerasi TaxID=2248773 RepID=UPI00137AC829|nr:glycosyltransferase family 4 protein [Ornithinimicrobium cerasi]